MLNQQLDTSECYGFIQVRVYATHGSGALDPVSRSPVSSDRWPFASTAVGLSRLVVMAQLASDRLVFILRAWLQRPSTLEGGLDPAANP